MAKLLNFRCPHELSKEIERIGISKFPLDKPHHQSNKLYDVTATVIYLLKSGINAEYGVKTNHQSTVNEVDPKIELLSKFIDLISE